MRTDPRTAAIAAAIAAALLVRAQPARACGPDFPATLLADRGATLFELDAGVFMAEAGRLVPEPSIAYTIVGGEEPAGARDTGTAAERALYDQGADAYKAGDTAAAVEAFTALLALPPELRRVRSTWAAYMLGRIEDPAHAIAAYRRVRALVADGFADDLGLAASSLGQEARIHLAGYDYAAAVELYAEQAAHGHPDGATSLLFVVRAVIEGRAERTLAARPIGQRALAAYLLTRSDELDDAERARVWRALIAVEPVAGADRLAAAAYRAGRWAFARELAERDPTAMLARWVLAKLALRDGDRAAGERMLAEVAAAIEADRTTCELDADAADADRERVRGERAVVALADNRHLDAMKLAWQARVSYPADALYIAERVLTLAELRAFVDGPTADDADDLGGEIDVPRDLYDYDYEAGWVANRDVIRLLLARRLMRAGRFDDAQLYFPTNLLGVARAFAAGIERGRNATDRIERARGLFDASLLARTHGLDILGTEHAPDWALYSASYDPFADVDDGSAPRVLDAVAPTADERARVDASAPTPDRRYHYRYLASVLAEQAADLLPHQSQAYAAALCHATRYVFNDDRARVDALYRRYIRTGPSVDFASSFGEDCPPPAFDRARRYLAPEPPSSSRLPIALAALALTLAVIMLGTRRWLLAASSR